MVRFALCDDNELQLSLIKDLLSDCLSERGEETSIATFSDGQALLEDIRLHGSYDAYILDMIMPGMNGLELATTLRLLKDEGEIIFLTSTLEYAVQSYDVHAFYYLLKPVEPAKFSRVIHDLLNKISQSKPDYFEVKTSSGTVSLKTQSVITVTGENRIPIYKLTNGQVVTGVMMRHKFRDEVTALIRNPNFVECGVSRVINLACIDTMDSESVMLCDGSVIYPPQSAISELMRKWLDYRRR